MNFDDYTSKELEDKLVLLKGSKSRDDKKLYK